MSDPGKDTPRTASRPTGPRRRDLIRGLAATGLGVGAGLTAGLAISEATGEDAGRRDEEPTQQHVRVEANGAHQAGIARPATPQAHGLVTVLDLAAVPAPGTADEAYRAHLRGIFARLGDAIRELTSDQPVEPAGLFDGCGDLTITVGLGPRLIAALDPSLPGATDLPAFAGDDTLAPERTGGDLLLAGYGGDPNTVRFAVAWLAGQLPDASVRWSQRGFRGPGNGTVTRNPLGFHDGIIVPHGAAELDDHVWIPDGPMAGGTICVMRRLRLDAAAFDAETLPDQQAVIGRHRHDGSPLSGGGPVDEVDLLSKSPDGQYLTPAGSHVRAAHPSFTGSHLMLRRGYAFDDGTLAGTRVADAGLLFICFQRDLRTFVATQHRLDETDRLMRYVTATGSATFLILPGFDAERPLGATLP